MLQNPTLKKILTISLPTFVILFFAVEMVTRMTKPRTHLYALTGREKKINPMSKWAKHSPFFAYTGIPGEHHKLKTINSHGFMSTPEIELSKKEGTKRIVFLGGSSTAGMGTILADDETWPWKVIERLRQESNHEIDFINAALGGFSTFESFGRLWSKIRFYDPDVIVVNHGWNEMYYFNEIAENPIDWRENFDLQKKVALRHYYPHWIDPFIRWSQVLSKIRINLAKLSSPNGEKPVYTLNRELKNTFNKKGIKIFQDNIRLIRDFCESNEIALFFCKQATLIHENVKEEDKIRAKYEYHGFDYLAHIAAFDSIYNIIDKEIPKDRIIDLTPISGVGEYFYDHVHPTELGADQISIIVKDFIMSKYFGKEKLKVTINE